MRLKLHVEIYLAASQLERQQGTFGLPELSDRVYRMFGDDRVGVTTTASVQCVANAQLSTPYGFNYLWRLYHGQFRCYHPDKGDIAHRSRAHLRSRPKQSDMPPVPVRPVPLPPDVDTVTFNIVDVLRKHALWLKDKAGGGRASLAGADLVGANLAGANLLKADLSNADLTKANLLGANLLEANLLRVNLSGANLSMANLTGASLFRTMMPDGSVHA